MLDVEMLKGIPEPWFSIDYDLSEQKIESGDGKKGFTGQTITEDFYFYTKLKQHGVDLWCDSSIQCLHEDRETGMTWGLTSNMPQHPGITIVEKGLLIADIGCGNTVNPLAYDNKVIRYDFDEKVNPDFRCDVRCIPENDNVFDIVQANHVLEHLPFRETTKALKEWFRIVKPGGRLEVRVPDLGYACSEIAKGNYGVMYEQDDITMPYNLLMLYGLQSCDGQIHFNGFDENLLRQACEIAGFKNFTVEKTGAQDSSGKPYELTATIHKNEATVLPTLSKEWKVINETTD
jgi:predicted SAM-dependent methyltransferase